MTPSESRLLKLRSEIIALPLGTPGPGYPMSAPGMSGLSRTSRGSHQWHSLGAVTARLPVARCAITETVLGSGPSTPGVPVPRHSKLRTRNLVLVEWMAAILRLIDRRLIETQ